MTFESETCHIFTICFLEGNNANQRNVKADKCVGMYPVDVCAVLWGLSVCVCVCDVALLSVWCVCVCVCAHLVKSYLQWNQSWSLFCFFRSTHLTDTTWCPSSRRPTPSRTPHTMSPHQHEPSWAKSSNMVWQTARLKQHNKNVCSPGFSGS